MAGNPQAITEVFRDVLARLAFLTADGVEKSTLPPAQSPMVVWMQFRGPLQGTLTLAVPEALCAQVAANLLGVEPTDPQALVRGMDATGELLNVTCGHVLIAIAGETPEFDLSPPRGESLPARGWEQLLNAPGSLGVLVEEEHPVLLHVAFEG